MQGNKKSTGLTTGAFFVFNASLEYSGYLFVAFVKKLSDYPLRNDACHNPNQNWQNDKLEVVYKQSNHLLTVVRMVGDITSIPNISISATQFNT